VEPQKVVDACINQIARLGGKIAPDIEVIDLLASSGNRVQAVHTANGQFQCDAVVLAAGLEVTRLAAMVGVYIPQEDSPGVVVRTDPQARLLHSVPVVYMPPINTHHQEVHLRQLADGALMIGEGSQESLSRDDSQAHADDLLGRAMHYLPALGGARAIPVPVGYRPMPLDGYPVLGFARQAPNVYIALTHSGVTLAPLIGQLASIEILDGARVEALDPCRPERFA
jgi:glycine/D-amino acid oxidase-like deaminating enzyme